MFPLRVRASLGIGLTLTPLIILAAACSRPPEQQYLTQFFRAARTRDNTTLAMMSAVALDPREQGEVVDFDITNVSEERRAPLAFKPLLDAVSNATAAEAEVRRQRLEFEGTYRPALEAIAKMERTAGAKFTAAQQTLKAQWDKFRADAGAAQKATAVAKAALSAATGPAEASLSQPGQPAFDVQKFEGELLSKDVTLNADFRTPDGQTAQKSLVVTIQRVVGKMDGTDRTGRSIITRIQGL